MSSFAELLPEYVQTLAIVVGGLWAYRKFVQQRSNEPATDIDVDLRLIGVQDNQHLIEMTAALENKSLVRLRYKNFRLSVRYLLPNDRIEDGAGRIEHQLNCTRTINERIEGEERHFANVDYIDPRQHFQHRYVTFVPSESTFVWVQCSLTFEMPVRLRDRLRSKRASKEVLMNTQNIFSTADQHEQDAVPLETAR